MDIRIRRTITVTFFLIFFIVSPFLLLYSSGFRYDFKRGAILRTGNIFIEAKDLRDATIYLDGKQYKELLTKKLFIKNLLPGEYVVKVEKEDRYAWEKTLRVEPTLTTFVKDLVLFAKKTPALEIAKDIKDYSISPDNKQMAYIAVDNGVQEVFIYNLEYPQEDLIYRESIDEPLQLNWAASSNKLMVSSKNEITIFKTSEVPATQSIKLPKKLDALAKWDNQSDNSIITALDGALIQNDLVTGASKKIYQSSEKNSQINDFWNKNSQLVILETTDQETSVKISSSLLNEPVKIAGLPKGGNYRIGDSNGKYLTIINSNLNKISVVRLRDEANPQELLKDSVISLDGKTAIFSNSQEKLLLINDFEINTFNLSSSQLNLISRFGQEIKSAFWYADDEHVVINLDDKIIISDLSVNTEKGLLEVAHGNSLNQSKPLNEKFIFFIGNIGEESGMFKLRLRQ